MDPKGSATISNKRTEKYDGNCRFKSLIFASKATIGCFCALVAALAGRRSFLFKILILIYLAPDVKLLFAMYVTMSPRGQSPTISLGSLWETLSILPDSSSLLPSPLFLVYLELSQFVRLSVSLHCQVLSEMLIDTSSGAAPSSLLVPLLSRSGFLSSCAC